MGPIVSVKSYLLTFTALLALTLVTVWVGFVDLRWGNIVVALAIALMKATLIACFFMHALLESKLVKLVIAGAILWFLILVSLTVGDYVTRGWLGFGGK